MTTILRVPLALICVVGFLAGCSSSEPDLMNFGPSRAGPDEFVVAPAKPLETPPANAALPVPTPGGANRADPRPLDDAVVALGGSASAANRSGSPAADGGLLRYASRLGRDPRIRDTLAREDLDYRRRNKGRLLERLTNTNIYYSAYDGYHLDQQGAMDRFRRAGIPTPGAPPAALKPR